MIDRPYRWLFGMTVAGVAVGLAEGAVLAIVVRVTLQLTTGESDPWVVPRTSIDLSPGGQLCFAAGSACIAMVLHVLIARSSARAASDVLVAARCTALQAFSDAAWERQEREREGSLQETVSTLASQSSQLATGLAAGVSSLLSLLALLGVAALIDPVATAVVTAAGIALAATLYPITALTRRRSTSYVTANSAFAEDVSQMTGLVQEYRVFGVQDRATQLLLGSNRLVAGKYEQTRFIQRLGWSLYGDVGVVLLVGAVAALYLVEQSSLLGAGTVVVLVVRALSSAQAVQRGAQNMHELGPNLAALDDRVRSLLSDAAVAGDEPLADIGVVELTNVSYRYSAAGRNGDALHCIDLRIEPGEVLGIVGPSGAGKSTLVQVLLRLRRPTSGTVSVAGRPYESYRDLDWSRLVTLVPQEPHLMEASVADNIRFLRDDIDDDIVRRSAEAAHIADEILALPHGFETRLGPRGIGLSGGQKQRLAIARALAGQPQLVVLDEPTSALDVHSEQLFMETIRELAGTITLVIVAHRATTLTACDRLLVLRDGRAEQLGPPDERVVAIGVAE